MRSATPIYRKVLDLLLAPELTMSLDEILDLSYIQHRMIMQELSRRRRK